MDTKQTSPGLVSEKFWRENAAKLKREFRAVQRDLSFNEKMQIAFGLSKRDEQIKKAKRK